MARAPRAARSGPCIRRTWSTNGFNGSGLCLFSCTSPDDLTTAIYAPTITNERLAGFGRDVVNAAKDEDRVALKIVADGGTELGYAAVAVIRNLQMERDRFRSPTSAVFSEQQAI